MSYIDHIRFPYYSNNAFSAFFFSTYDQIKDLTLQKKSRRSYLIFGQMIWKKPAHTQHQARADPEANLNSG